MGLIWGNYGDSMAKLRRIFFREMIDYRYKRAMVPWPKPAISFVYIFPDLEIRRHHVHPITTTIHFNTVEKDTLARGVWIKNCLSFHRGVAALTAHLDYTKFVQVLDK